MAPGKFYASHIFPESPLPTAFFEVFGALKLFLSLGVYTPLELPDFYDPKHLKQLLRGLTQ
ncbi:MAG: hypothetical protein D6714_04730 [Bacteroidetes bacterium]|nr:MAG: hypothetical protein D6714_04730 [Bacteroidota bacterium]